jgi:hypothetical protein
MAGSTNEVTYIKYKTPEENLFVLNNVWVYQSDKIINLQGI